MVTSDALERLSTEQEKNTVSKLQRIIDLACNQLKYAQDEYSADREKEQHFIGKVVVHFMDNMGELFLRVFKNTTEKEFDFFIDEARTVGKHNAENLRRLTPHIRKHYRIKDKSLEADCVTNFQLLKFNWYEACWIQTNLEVFNTFFPQYFLNATALKEWLLKNYSGRSLLSFVEHVPSHIPASHWWWHIDYADPEAICSMQKKIRTVTSSNTHIDFEVCKLEDKDYEERIGIVDGKAMFASADCTLCWKHGGGVLKKIAKENVAVPLIAKELSQQLKSEITQLDDSLLDIIDQHIPTGDYVVLLRKIKPRLMHFGDKEDYFSNEYTSDFFSEDPDPKTHYYPFNEKVVLNDGKDYRLIEMLVPFVSETELDRKRIRRLKKEYERSKNSPTVLAVGLWDIYGVDDTSRDPDVVRHDSITHYVLGGHHELHAAALAEKEITLLTYVRTENYFGNNFLENYSRLDWLYIPNAPNMRDVYLSNVVKDIASAHLFGLQTYWKYKKVQDLCIEIINNDAIDSLAQWQVGLTLSKAYKNGPEQEKKELEKKITTTDPEIRKVIFGS